MNIIIAKDYANMSAIAAKMIIEKINTSTSYVLGLATGGTPIGTYECLQKEHQENGTSYQHVNTFNLDEYIGLPSYHPNSYTFYMKHNLFKHIDIPNNQTHLPNGLVENVEIECELYEEKIKHLGGIDLQLLGIGINGHIGFNEPGTPFYSRTHPVSLTTSTIQANARYFNNISEVPSKAITMGIQTIMESKQILLLISGIKKADILFKLLREEPTEEIPASVLKRHPNVTIITDEEALTSIRKSGFNI